MLEQRAYIHLIQHISVALGYTTGEYTHLIVRDPSLADVVQNLSSVCSSRCPCFLYTINKVSVSRKETIHLDIIKQRRYDATHACHLGKPIVHLDVDVRI